FACGLWRSTRSPCFPYTTLFRSDLADRLLERADHVGIGRLVEADVAVADLQEAELAGLGSHGRVDDAERARHAARDCPQHPGPRSEEHTSELQSRVDLVCRLLLE